MKIKNPFKRPFYKRTNVTGKGKCLVKYIIGKYLNLEDNYIEEYEKTIQNIRNIFKMEETEVNHRFFALLIAGVHLRAMSPEERKIWYDMIEDEDDKEEFINFVNRDELYREFEKINFK